MEDNSENVESEAIQKLIEFKSAIATAKQWGRRDRFYRDNGRKNIGKILQERTKNATATVEDISEGKI